MNRSCSRSVLTALVVLSSASCDGHDEPTAVPTPGTLVVSLSTPNTDDGAMVISIQGGGMAGPAAASSSYEVHHRATGLSSMRVAVVGNLVAGPILRFGVPDVGQASSYSATVTQVADRTNGLKTGLGDYRLDIAAEGGGSP